MGFIGTPKVNPSGYGGENEVENTVLKDTIVFFFFAGWGEYVGNEILGAMLEEEGKMELARKFCNSVRWQED